MLKYFARVRAVLAARPELLTMSNLRAESVRDSPSIDTARAGKLDGVLRVFVLFGMAWFASLPAVAASSPAAPGPNRALAAVTLGQWNHPGSIAGRVEADLDGDGILDYAELSRVPLEITIRLSGAPSRHVPLLEPALALAVVDLDLDGDRDLVAVSGGPHVFVWLNDGFGAFDLRSSAFSGLLVPHLQTAPDLVDFSPSPVLQFAEPSSVGSARSGSPTFKPAPRAVRRVYDAASPRAPPSSPLLR
jgi:hypothetical protein